eukprot:TRINITY_DN9619_c0_g1_i1.p1 TRINITY_DN9619_c0_g1~~TRINITY_DN9619_c0_g1_i1.p1  ORF type:complete len:319 (-),score=36.28 TRINITY_DN9619_c0_g1_i1:53-1009(-)
MSTQGGKKFEIRVPASSANLGPGFDVLGLAYRLYLRVEVTLNNDEKQQQIKITSQGKNAEEIPLDSSNLIVTAANTTASVYDKTLPFSLHLHINNEIPLGKGLGSSGAAIVAGVLLANELCDLRLSQDKMLEHVVQIEGHPDNVTTSLKGGFVSSSAVQEKTTTVYKFISLPVHSSVVAVVVTPVLSLSTKKARGVLPPSYSVQDTVFNLQRIPFLLAGLAQCSKELIRIGIQDRIHQPYRAKLVPGLEEILDLNNQEVSGLLGVCLSGAGPSILAFGHEDTKEVVKRIQVIFKSHLLDSEVQVLDIDRDGAVVIRHT